MCFPTNQEVERERENCTNLPTPGTSTVLRSGGGSSLLASKFSSATEARPVSHGVTDCFQAPSHPDVEITSGSDEPNVFFAPINSLFEDCNYKIISRLEEVSSVGREICWPYLFLNT